MSDDPTSLSSASAIGGESSEQIDAPKLPRVRKRKRKRGLWRRYGPILTLIGLLLLGWVLYALVWPTLEIRYQIAKAKWKYYPDDPEVSIPLRIMLRTCEYLYCFWFFYFGASIGSFINVVANRVPQGQTIVSRGSHCPFCDRRLGMIDNTPIFGWIALRGRCRTCHLPISPRYLIMEIVVGAIFMSLAIVELMGNGMNLPHRDWKHSFGIVSTVFYPKWDLIGAYLTHASLFAVVVMLIGSHMDRLRFPLFPLIVIGMIYVACATFEPIVAPVRWIEPWGPAYPRMVAVPWEKFQSSIIGLAAGGLMGFGFAFLHGRTLLRPEISSDSLAHDGPAENGSTGKEIGTGNWFFHSLVIFMLVGTLLGWQVVLLVGFAASAIIFLVLKLTSLGDMAGLAKDPVLRPQVLALAILTITLLLHHLCWRQLAFLPLPSVLT